MSKKINNKSALRILAKAVIETEEHPEDEWQGYPVVMCQHCDGSGCVSKRGRKAVPIKHEKDCPVLLARQVLGISGDEDEQS